MTNKRKFVVTSDNKMQFLAVFNFFSKKVLTYKENSCNIIQVADRHGHETV